MRRDIIVVGASAGGVQALSRFVAALPVFPAAVFVTLHVSPSGMSVLPAILARVASGWTVAHAVDGEAIRPGHIVVAPPNRHLLIDGDRVRLGDGPLENGHRPAIDPLFRSAAQSHRGRVVGIILSGTLDDGTAGLWAVKRRGGVAIVQDPAEAQHAGMIQSALDQVSVDHVLPASEIAGLLALLHSETFPDSSPVPLDPLMAHEIELATHARHGGMPEHPYGTAARPSPMACPDCGGVLWEIPEGEAVRYRCRVGHAYGAVSLLAEQDQRLEEALWSACRSLEESAALALRLARRAGNAQHEAARLRFERRAHRSTSQATLVRQLLESLAQTKEPSSSDNPVDLSSSSEPEEP